MAQIDIEFAQALKIEPQSWSNDSVKINLNALNLTEAQQVEAMRIASSYASSKFYKDGVPVGDTYLYYWLMVSIPNSVLMAAVIEALKK